MHRFLAENHMPAVFHDAAADVIGQWSLDQKAAVADVVAEGADEDLRARDGESGLRAVSRGVWLAD